MSEVGNRLAGQTAIIFGASSGVGLVTARVFAGEGAKVVLSARRANLIEQAAEEISASGGAAIAVECDVREEASVQRVVAAALETYGKLDIAFNNAGINMAGPVDEMATETWDTVHTTNARGAWLCCKHVIPSMRDSGGGAIVNTASMRAWTGSPNQTAYNSSKGAVFALTKALAIECAPYNIRVNCISPGWIDTEYARRFFNAQPDPEAARAATLAQYPMGRAGRPEDVAYGALFLASNEASYVTGHSLVIDGGFTAR